MGDVPIAMRAEGASPWTAGGGAGGGPAVYEPESIALATFLGTPVAGAVLWAWNERVAGRPLRAVVALLVGLGLTAALFALALVLPSDLSAMMLLVHSALVMGARALARRWREGEHVRRRLAGTRNVSRWAAAGLGLAGAAAVAGAVLAVVLAQQPPSVEVRPGARLYYLPGVTEQDARHVAEVLRPGVAAGTNALDLRYSQTPTGHALSFVVEAARVTPAVLERFQDLADGLHTRIARGEELEIRLCDAAWQRHHTVTAK
ncbi:MAG: hypothetical protein HY908_35045 [Myxococcales bacterium]|nr:hypothetical protein [Myxococcales bacterium]